MIFLFYDKDTLSIVDSGWLVKNLANLESSFTTAFVTVVSLVVFLNLLTSKIENIFICIIYTEKEFS